MKKLLIIAILGNLLLLNRVMSQLNSYGLAFAIKRPDYFGIQLRADAQVFKGLYATLDVTTYVPHLGYVGGDSVFTPYLFFNQFTMEANLNFRYDFNLYKNWGAYPLAGINYSYFRLKKVITRAFSSTEITINSYPEFNAGIGIYKDFSHCRIFMEWRMEALQAYYHVWQTGVMLKPGWKKALIGK